MPPMYVRCQGRDLNDPNADSELCFLGIRFDEQGRCPLRRVKLPRSKHWSQVGRPGGFRHITMEEAEAMIWSLDSRLRRPDELGCRIVTGGDNAPQVGAFMRGRSPSHALNGCCRKACAIELAGNFMPFSLGKHNCIGQVLAGAHLHTIVARICSEFELTLEDEGKADFFMTLKPVGARLKATRVSR